MKANIESIISSIDKSDNPNENQINKLAARDIVYYIIEKSKKVFEKEENLLRLEGNVIVVGDIHGDILTLSKIFKENKSKGQIFLFLGNIIDQGKYSLESIVYLLAKKCANPDKIFILRGNHETEEISKTYGFLDQIESLFFSDNLWIEFNNLFRYFPIAAIVNSTTFCVHSGLSPDLLAIEKLMTFDRTAEEINPLIMDIIWSRFDPESDTWIKMPFSQGYVFGVTHVTSFLHANKLTAIVRSNQLCQDGCSQECDNKLITVWSCPNFCERENNEACIYVLDKDPANCKSVKL